MIEEFCLVNKQLIEATVERVLLDQCIILAEKISHRALLKPRAVQSPFATGIDQPITNQRLQDRAPTSAFSRVR
jgi:hypothetical protein